MTSETKPQPTTKTAEEFNWIRKFSDLATQTPQLPVALWRENMLAAAELAKLQAEWLAKLASVTSPLDVAALTNEHCQNVFRKVVDENSRIAAAVTSLAGK